MIKNVMDKNIRKFIIGLSGSATNDVSLDTIPLKNL